MGIELGQFREGDKLERRISKRHEMRAPAILETDSRESIEVIICNATQEGFELEIVSDKVVPLYSVCVVQVTGFFNTQCFAIWSSGKRIGMLIASPIHASVIASLAKRFPAPPRGEDLIGLPIG